ncbi:MAG: hypothetical protein WCL51_06330 [Bacteroidota bacterium]
MKSNIPKKPVTPAAKDNIKAIKKEPKEIKTTTDKLKEYGLLAVVLIWAAIMWYYMFK